jgi:hypothetical protein
MLVVSINDMEPLCVWGHHLHQVADVVIEAAYCLLGFQKNANLPTLPQSGTCPQRFHPAMRGLLITAVMSIKRAFFGERSLSHPPGRVSSRRPLVHSESLEKAQDERSRFLGLFHLHPMPRAFHDFNKA